MSNKHMSGSDAWKQYNKEEIPTPEVAQVIKELLELFQVDLKDPNFTETPDRVAKAFSDTWLAGYGQNVEDVVTVFPNDRNEDGMVIVKDIPFYSMCAHHMAPFFGKASIAYVPDKHVLGLSKMSRVLNVYARRLQLQEIITQQVADALMGLVRPKGVMVVLSNVEHTCMTSRGVQAHGAVTTTSEVRGVFNQQEVRQEALSLISIRG